MFCKWIERYIGEIKKKSGNSTTFVSNETRTSVNNYRMKNIGLRENDSTPVSNVTIDDKAG